MSSCHYVTDDGDIENDEERRRRIQAEVKELVHSVFRSSGNGNSLEDAPMTATTAGEESFSNNTPTPDPPEAFTNEEEQRSHKYFERIMSQSTTTIIYTDDSYDPTPIVPNKTPGTPDVWIPRSILRA